MQEALQVILQKTAYPFQTAARWLSQRRVRIVKGMVGAALALLLTGACAFGMLCAISGAVKHSTKDQIYKTAEDLPEGDYDCILVLGCRVYSDGTMSPMLQDRMTVATDLMLEGGSPRLIVSGDHTTDNYDEVKAMKNYAVEMGVDSSAIFQDHDGYSTYDSMARLKTVYGVKRVIIVTQEYHLHRALYLAKVLGMEAVGVSADLQTYMLQKKYDFREIFARCKDVYYGQRRPTPAGDLSPIPLTGNGDDTAQSRPALH